MTTPEPARLSDRRLRIGRLAIYLEPRDAWVGVYVAPDAVYVLLVPFVVFRWDRRTVNLGSRLRRLHAAVNGCDECSAEPGERHRYPECPGNWRAAQRMVSDVQ